MPSNELDGKRQSWTRTKITTRPSGHYAFEVSMVREYQMLGWPVVTLFIFILAVSAGMGQGVSSNNFPGDALRLSPGQAIQESISKAGETDYFLFPVDTSGIVSVSLNGVPTDMRPRIVVTNEYTGLWTSSANVADKTATNAGDSLALEKDVFGPSGYWIAILDADGKAHNTPYSLTVDFKPAPDANEPNNLPGEATIVKPNQLVEAYICPSNDLDYYRLDINTSGTLTLKVENVPADMKPRAIITNEYTGLWTSSANVADKTATNAGDSLTLEKDLLGPSGYYIQVMDADGKAHADPYTVTFAFEPAPDNHEPDNDIGDATEIKLDEAVTAYICPGDDKDFYKLYLNSPGVAVLKVDSLPADMRPYLVVRDKNNRQIADKSATNPGDSLTLEKDLGTGWNYIAVSDADGKAHSKPYTLSVSLKGSVEGAK
jgi:hypothetical protein